MRVNGTTPKLPRTLSGQQAEHRQLPGSLPSQGGNLPDAPICMPRADSDYMLEAAPIRRLGSNCE